MRAGVAKGEKWIVQGGRYGEDEGKPVTMTQVLHGHG